MENMAYIQVWESGVRLFGDYCIVMGNDCVVEGDYAIVWGSNCLVLGDYSIIYGPGNHIDGDCATILAPGCTVAGEDAREFPNDYSAEAGKCGICNKRDACAMVSPCAHVQRCIPCAAADTDTDPGLCVTCNPVTVHPSFLFPDTLQ